MHIISKRPLQEFWEAHPDSKGPLLGWHKLVSDNDFENFAELKQVFGSADWVDGLVVFNIGGNKYRLITAIHFGRGKVYVRHVLTHEEYDRGHWKGT